MKQQKGHRKVAHSYQFWLTILDRELEKRGYRFIRYADELVIYVKTRRAGERVMGSITHFLERNLGLTINYWKSKVCGAISATFRGSMYKTNGKVGCRPSKLAKQRFKDKLRNLTSRKRLRTIQEIIKKINQTTSRWINYYGISNMK